MTAPAVELREASLGYDHGQHPVLDRLSFAILHGERVAVVGLNGAGKTTLLQAIVGLTPHRGEISVCGQRLSRRTAPEIRRRVGFLFNVPEDQLLFPTAAEDVAFGLVRGGIPVDEARRRARLCLRELGADDLAEQPLHHLSHGQKLRIALAGAIVTGPPLLLLDEPTAGLDPPGRHELARLLSEQSAAQLIATHDLELVDRLCTRVLLLESGLVAVDAPDTAEVRSRWDRGS
jgi:cobalt/nickel transport system ATP-binding protein